MTETFKAHAPDISCGGCASGIKRSLGSVPGVQTVEVDIPGKNVTIQYDTSQLNDNDIRARLEKAGYPTQ